MKWGSVKAPPTLELATPVECFPCGATPHGKHKTIQPTNQPNNCYMLYTTNVTIKNAICHRMCHRGALSGWIEHLRMECGEMSVHCTLDRPHWTLTRPLLDRPLSFFSNTFLRNLAAKLDWLYCTLSLPAHK